MQSLRWWILQVILLCTTQAAAPLQVNHISPASAEFQDFLEHGNESKTADMWIDWEKFWPKGKEGVFDQGCIADARAFLRTAWRIWLSSASVRCRCA